MSHEESKTAAPGPSTTRKLAGSLAVGAAALALSLGAASPAGAAGRAYDSASCSLAATVTPAGVVFAYDPPPNSAGPRNFGLHVVDGPFVGGQTLTAGEHSRPLEFDLALLYEVHYAGLWLEFADVADCAFPPVTVTTPAPPATVPEPPVSTEPPAVEIGVPTPPMTAPPTTAVVEVLQSTLTAARTLPETGRPTGQLAMLGLGFLGAGAWTLRTARRLV